MTEVVQQETAPRRGQRDCRSGVVIARSGEKTIKVRYDFTVRHAKYGKYMRRYTALHAHDENNEAQVGDKVEVVACRRISKTKSWRLTRIVEKH